MKIGFFDSGLGGLTVLKATVALLPQYDYEFYGDTANVPYGDKSEEIIYDLTKKAICNLFEKDCALVVVACNTASAETLRRLQDTFLIDEYPDRKILGVIIPMVEEVVALGSTHALLLATKRTINSEKYEKEFSKLPNSPKLISLATPQLVPLIELGLLEEATQNVCEIISSYDTQKIDALILGCTHYSLLKEGIEAICTDMDGIHIFSQTEIIPKKLELYLEVHEEIREKLSKKGTRNIFLSTHTPAYDQIVGDILGGHFISEE